MATVKYRDATTGEYRLIQVAGTGVGGFIELDARYINSAGDVMDGPLEVQEPIDPSDAASKAYVDRRTPNITVGTTAPSSPAVGDVWVDMS